MRGDLVLFKSSPSPFDQLIKWATRPGDFVHVELDLGDGNFIGAVNNGIDIHQQQVGNGIVHVPVAPLSTETDITAALAWAVSQKGSPYGWVDIFSSGLRFFGSHFTISRLGHYDCSDFATRYLLIARAAGPLGALALHPETVSPNDIGRAFRIPS